MSLIQQITLNPDIDHAHFHVYTGLSHIMLPIVPLGAAGCVDGTAGWFPKTIVRLYTLSANESPTPADVAERKTLSLRVSRETDIANKHGVPGIKEAIARLRGFGSVGATRLPLSGGITGGDAEWAHWAPIMKACDDIEKTL